jgi:hypothetical protein
MRQLIQPNFSPAVNLARLFQGQNRLWSPQSAVRVRTNTLYDVLDLDRNDTSP